VNELIWRVGSALEGAGRGLGVFEGMGAARRVGALGVGVAVAVLAAVDGAVATNSSCCACPAEAEDEGGQGDVAFAFAMSIGAGMCTTIGGAAAFLGKIEDKRILAVSLALSAGVMIYVSFIEIFVKSVGGFTDQFLLDSQEAAAAERNAYYAATGFFFLGMVLTRLLDVGLSKLEQRAAEESVVGAAGICEDGCGPGDVHGAKAAGYAATAEGILNTSEGKTSCTEILSAEKLLEKYDTQKQGALDLPALEALVRAVNSELKSGGGKEADGDPQAEGIPNESGMTSAEAARLQQMGMFTALSIFIHNFPEGLATFIATMADPAAGAALAVAIGMHNIPEGICVGFPIYYATGSRWKAFGVSFLSGVSEPLGGLIGYLLMCIFRPMVLVASNRIAVPFGYPDV
jgi:ZIP family zinc transporter